MMLTFQRIMVGRGMWTSIMALTMRPIFPKGGRSYRPDIGIVDKWHSPWAIVRWMPRPLRVVNTMDIDGGIILSLLPSFAVVAIGMHMEVSPLIVMISFSSIGEFWMLGKIDVHNRVVRR